MGTAVKYALNAYTERVSRRAHGPRYGTNYEGEKFDHLVSGDTPRSAIFIGRANHHRTHRVPELMKDRTNFRSTIHTSVLAIIAH